MKTSAHGKTEVNVLVCRGDLNAQSMVRLKSRLSRLMNQNRKRLVLDLARAKRADFSGLGILIERLQKIRAMRGDIRVIHVQPAVSKTFDRTGISQLIESFESKMDAIRSYRVAT